MTPSRTFSMASWVEIALISWLLVRTVETNSSSSGTDSNVGCPFFPIVRPSSVALMALLSLDREMLQTLAAMVTETPKVRTNSIAFPTSPSILLTVERERNLLAASSAFI